MNSCSYGACGIVLKPQILVSLLLATSLLTLFSGCEEKTTSIVPNQIALTVNEIADDYATFTLSNGTSQKIALEGTRTLFGRVHLWRGVSEMSCQTAPFQNVEQQPFMLIGGHGSSYEVPPGESMTFVIDTNLPARFRGRGTCNVRIHLASRQFVGPLEFRP